MTTHRAVLPISHPKCVANATRCPRTDHCASHCVAYAPGRSVANWSLSSGWDAENCAGFLPLDYHGPEAPKKVHEAPKGIC